MHFKTDLMAYLAIIAVILLSLFTKINATDSLPKHITDPKMNYTIKGDDVILHSYIGDIKIPMPAYVKASLRSEKNSKIVKKRVTRQIGFIPSRNINYNINPFAFPDFFECNEQAQIALSAYSDNHRYWEAFFKRNSINDTIAVGFFFEKWT